MAVALEDPAEALRSIDDLKEAGFRKIGVYDLTGHEVDPDQLRDAVAQHRLADEKHAAVPHEART